MIMMYAEQGFGVMHCDIVSKERLNIQIQTRSMVV
jgi:hypothetical protein